MNLATRHLPALGVLAPAPEPGPGPPVSSTGRTVSAATTELPQRMPSQFPLFCAAGPVS